MRVCRIRCNKERKRDKAASKAPAKAAARTERGRIFRNKALQAVTLVLLCVMLAVFLFTVIVDQVVARTGRKYVRTPSGIPEDLDCIIVPGASVIANRYPSIILQDRLDAAYALYLSSGIRRILVSGDNGSVHYDEVDVMRDYLIAKGVPGEDVFMDHAGFDTYQTIYRARDIFCVRKAVIVTQGFHLYRALYIGEKLGIELYGVDSASRRYGREIYNRLREYPARVKAFIECEITRPEPKFLGEKIPIDGENRTLG